MLENYFLCYGNRELFCPSAEAAYCLKTVVSSIIGLRSTLVATAKRRMNAADICHARLLGVFAGVSVAAIVVDELIGVRPTSQNVVTSLRLPSGLF